MTTTYFYDLLKHNKLPVRFYLGLIFYLGKHTRLQIVLAICAHFSGFLEIKRPISQGTYDSISKLTMSTPIKSHSPHQHDESQSNGFNNAVVEEDNSDVEQDDSDDNESIYPIAMEIDISPNKVQHNNSKQGINETVENDQHNEHIQSMYVDQSEEDTERVNRIAIQSVVRDKLFPRIKFLDRDKDLEFSLCEGTICHYIFKMCKFDFSNEEKKILWEKARTWVITAIVRLRCDKCSSLRDAFFGKNPNCNILFK